MGGQGAAAQEALLRTWTVQVAIGNARGTSARGVESAMRAGGFDQGYVCIFLCTGTIAHPLSVDADFGTTLTVSRRLRWPVQVSAIVGRSPMGETSGYDGSSPGSAFVHLRQSVDFLGITAGANAGKWKYLEASASAGPALYRAYISPINGTPVSEQSRFRIGAMLGARVAFPGRTRLFVSVDAQARFVGTAGFNAFTIDATRSIPPTRVNFNHTVLLSAFGVRL